MHGESVGKTFLNAFFGCHKRHLYAAGFGPLLPLQIYINDFYNAIRFSSPFCFTDGRCILNICTDTYKSYQQKIKYLMKLSFWLSTYIPVNFTKRDVRPTFQNQIQNSGYRTDTQTLSKQLMTL